MSKCFLTTGANKVFLFSESIFPADCLRVSKDDMEFGSFCGQAAAAVDAQRAAIHL